jgi:hypothetical protein
VETVLGCGRKEARLQGGIDGKAAARTLKYSKIFVGEDAKVVNNSTDKTKDKLV